MRMQSSGARFRVFITSCRTGTRSPGRLATRAPVDPGLRRGIPSNRQKSQRGGVIARLVALHKEAVIHCSRGATRRREFCPGGSAPCRSRSYILRTGKTKQRATRAIGLLTLAIIALPGLVADAVEIDPIFHDFDASEMAIAESVISQWEGGLAIGTPTDWVVIVHFRWTDLGGFSMENPDCTGLIGNPPPGNKVGQALLGQAWYESFTPDQRIAVATIRMNSNTDIEWHISPTMPMPGEGRFDFQTVLSHELGHAVGFSLGSPRFARNVTSAGATSCPEKTYNDGVAPTACITAQGGGHIDVDSSDLMYPSIDSDERRGVTQQHHDLLNHDVWRIGATEVLVTSPLNGDSWAIGTDEIVAWTYQSSVEFDVDIEINRGMGGGWEPLVLGIAGRTDFQIEVPGPPTPSAQIRVCSSDDNSLCGYSGFFEITAVPQYDIVHIISGTLPFEDHDQVVAFSPDSRWLATRKSGGYGVYDLTTIQQAFSFPGGTSGAVGFSADSHFVATTTTSGETLHMREVSTGSVVCSAETNDRDGESIVWISSAELALVGDSSGGETQFVEYTSGCGGGSSFSVPSGDAINSLSYFGGNYYGGSEEGVVYRWSTGSANPASQVDACMSIIYSVECSPDGTKLAVVGRGESACNRPNVAVYSLPNLGLINRTNIGTALTRVYGVAWNPSDSEQFAVATDDGERFILSSSAQIVATLEPGSGSSTDVAWSGSGLIAVLGSDCDLYAPWDISPPEVVIGAWPGVGSPLPANVFDDVAVAELSVMIDGEQVSTPDPNPDGSLAIDLSGLIGGNYSVVVCATDLAGNQSCESVLVQIPCIAIASPVPEGPPNATLCLPLPIVIEWAPAPMASMYELELTHPGSVEVISLEGESIAPASLIPGTSYSWRVRGIDGCENPGPWSSMQVFETAPALLAGPAEAFPRSGVIVSATGVVVSWEPVPEALVYEVRYGPDCSATGSTFMQLQNGELSVEITELAMNSTTWWKVRGVDSCGAGGAWSDCRSITTSDDPTAVGGTPPVSKLTILGAIPNPLNPSTRIMFELPRRARTVVTIYNLRGRQVSRDELGVLPAGSNSYDWNGTDEIGRQVASGSYRIAIQAGKEQSSVSVTLLK